jgi:hypothetical protein
MRCLSSEADVSRRSRGRVEFVQYNGYTGLYARTLTFTSAPSRAFCAANTMSRAALSIKFFAAYLFLLGAVFIVAPNLLLSQLGIPTAEGWVRIVGLLAFNIGAYGWVAARNEYRAFFVVSVWLRVEVWLVLTVLAALGLVPPVIALFGVADLIGAVWTQWCLRSDARTSQPSRTWQLRGSAAPAVGDA